jgi:hypothetical protein
MADDPHKNITVRSQIVGDDVDFKDDNMILNKGITADTIINSWNANRNKLHKALIDGQLMSNLDTVVGHDSRCKNYMGTGKRPLNNKFKCEGCNYVGILFPDQRIIGDVITIQVGKYIGKQYKIKPNHDGQLGSYTHITTPIYQSMRIIEKLKNMRACETSLSDMVFSTHFYVTSNSATQYAIISLLMEAELNKFWRI